jgi:hypothetical protein
MGKFIYMEIILGEFFRSLTRKTQGKIFLMEFRIYASY